MSGFRFIKTRPQDSLALNTCGRPPSYRCTSLSCLIGGCIMGAATASFTMGSGGWHGPPCPYTAGYHERSWTVATVPDGPRHCLWAPFPASYSPQFWGPRTSTASISRGPCTAATCRVASPNLCSSLLMAFTETDRRYTSNGHDTASPRHDTARPKSSKFSLSHRASKTCRHRSPRGPCNHHMDI